jgi:hypothetical protein
MTDKLVNELQDEIAFLTARAELAEEDAMEGWTEAYKLAVQFRGINGLGPIGSIRKRIDAVKMRMLANNGGNDA